MPKAAGYVFGGLVLIVTAFAAALLASPRLRAETYSFIQHDNARFHAALAQQRRR